MTDSFDGYGKDKVGTVNANTVLDVETIEEAAKKAAENFGAPSIISFEVDEESGMVFFKNEQGITTMVMSIEDFEELKKRASDAT